MRKGGHDLSVLHGEEDVVFRRLVARVESGEMAAGGAYHHNTAGGLTDTGAWADMEEETSRRERLEAMRARDETSQLAVMRAASERASRATAAELLHRVKRARRVGAARSTSDATAAGDRGMPSGTKKREAPKVIAVVKKRTDPGDPARAAAGVPHGDVSGDKRARRETSDRRGGGTPALNGLLGGYDSGGGSDDDRGDVDGESGREGTNRETQRDPREKAAAAPAKASVESPVNVNAIGWKGEEAHGRRALETRSGGHARDARAPACAVEREDSRSRVPTSDAPWTTAGAGLAAAPAPARADGADHKGKQYWERYYEAKYGFGDGGGFGASRTPRASNRNGNGTTVGVTDWTAYYAEKYGLDIKHAE